MFAYWRLLFTAKKPLFFGFDAGAIRPSACIRQARVQGDQGDENAAGVAVSATPRNFIFAPLGTDGIAGKPVPQEVACVVVFLSQPRGDKVHRVSTGRGGQ
jgi:hypothetical protein